ncbi:prepilin-type N-terminal cleavage/methylation domain-containing protein [Salibacterium salarium]|uniref:Prepilin-type N-terminal cleavage/methylation domain-containing protein n=1 Tax=Salibacterium salarium TaxID=284579 RepID=A0A428MXT8_9BACI|nr:competence type IV pilus minor pilin ComGF [Salibacterium salarium]RSL30973.1 prepilin-type N-terminal cleavage/methylation domain-containing protein [Salibacterium salarium]
MKSVYSFCRNKKGMTLIEILVSLTVLMICASVIIFYVPLFKTDTLTSRQEIQLFFQQLKDDVDHAYTVERSKNEIVIKEKDNYFQYVKSGKNIVRRKNGSGHEIVLQNINGFSAQVTPYGANVHVTDSNDVKWSGVLGIRPAFKGGNVE